MYYLAIENRLTKIPLPSLVCIEEEAVYNCICHIYGLYLISLTRSVLTLMRQQIHPLSMQRVCYQPTVCMCVYSYFPHHSPDTMWHSQGPSSSLLSNLQPSKCSHAITEGISSAAFWNCNGPSAFSGEYPAYQPASSHNFIPLSLLQQKQRYVHQHLIYVLIVYERFVPPVTQQML